MSRSILEDKIPTLQYDTVEDDLPHIYDFIDDDTYTEMQPIPSEKTYTEIQPEYYNCGEFKRDPSFMIDCPAYGTCDECGTGDDASDNSSLGSQCGV